MAIPHSFSYRIAGDDIGSVRYRFSYFAQFEIINENIEYCAARIYLPTEKGGSLYINDSISFLVYAACYISYQHKHVIVKDTQIINLSTLKICNNKDIEIDSQRVYDFVKDEILVDRYCYYFIEKQIYNENSSAFDISGQAILVFANIMYDFDDEYIIHNIIDKIFYNIINTSRINLLNLVDFPIDLNEILLAKMYRLERSNIFMNDRFIKKDLDYFINNPLNLNDKTLRKLWFKEDSKCEDYILACI